MLSFFTSAVDNRLDGTRAYLESIQRVFSQDEVSGLIEVQFVSGEQFDLLYLSGQLIRCYRLGEDQVSAITPAEFAAFWKDEEAHLRSLEMPLQAVRLVMQTLEWSPPTNKEEIPVGELAARLEKLKAAKMTGLVRATAPQMDGLFVLYEGQVNNAESVFSTVSGLASDLPNLRQFLNPATSCQIVYYHPRLESSSYQAFRLRMATGNWVTAILARYQQLVGSNLLNPLNYDVNTAMRLKRVNMRLVGAVLVDHHLFLDRQSSQAAYRLLLENLTQHMAKVVGTELAPRVLQDAFKRLSEADQLILQADGLTPIVSELS